MKRHLLTTAAIGVIVSTLYPVYAFADAETDELKAEVKALEARIDQLEKRDQALAKQLARTQTQTQTTAQPATAAPAVNTNLSRRVAIVERKQEVDEEVAKEQAAKAPTVDIGAKGITVTSPDKQYSLNMYAYIQADDRTFLDNGATGPTNTFLLRSARPVINAKITDYFDGRFMMDFGKGQTTLLDAYGDFHPLPGSDLVSLRAGEMKVPVGLERWQGEQDVEFVERGQTTNLVPYRDIGAMLHGNLIPNQLEYEAGVFNGAADFQANTGDSDNNKDFGGRLFAHPLQWSGIQALEGIGLGVGGTYGVHQGSAAAPGLTTGYLTTGQRTYFLYRNATGNIAYADGPQWRINPQLMYYNGSFGLLGEKVFNDQQIAINTSETRLRNDAWMASAAYVLTGEDATFTGVKPKHDFNPQAGNWAAFELVGRLSDLNVDRKAFPTFADPAASSREAFEKAIGINWYFNPSVKLNLDFAATSFEGGTTGGANHAEEKAILTRTQIVF